MQMLMALAVAGVLMLAGCGGGGSRGASMAGMPSGGGGGGTPTPQTYGPGTVPLPTGHTLETGTLPVGGSRTVGETDGMETVIRCTAGSENCRFTVAADGTVTLIAGSLRIEIVGIRVTPTTPTPPTTPPTRVIEPPLVSWGELPALVDRMTHRTELRSVHFPGTSCDDGVTACQAVVKDLLAGVTEQTGRASYLVKRFRGTKTVTRWFSNPYDFPIPEHLREAALSYRSSEEFLGGWLDNSIFLVSRKKYHVPYRPAYEGGDPYFDYWDTTGRDRALSYISMGIRDANPVTGVYRGEATLGTTELHNSPTWGTFELNYTSGATGGQLDFTVSYGSYLSVGPVTWSNVSVDNEGHFDNDVRIPNHDVAPLKARPYLTAGPKKLEGRFYQGGEVGGCLVSPTSTRMSFTPQEVSMGHSGESWSLPVPSQP